VKRNETILSGVEVVQGYFQFKISWAFGGYLYYSTYSAANNSKILHLYTCRNFCDGSIGHESQYGRGPWWIVSVSLDCFSFIMGPFTVLGPIPLPLC
jgi:hypothetical protein